MPLASGATFAGYTILRLLGSGGMGEVYLAQHPRLPRRDALKILRNDVSADDDYRQRFIREADLAAALWHPNIVRVNDRGEFNGQLWISMDFVDGTDAASLLRDRYPAGMPADEVATIITAIASALDYAHQHDLLHRDVKPANILLTNPEDGDQRILLGDFGIARNIGEISGLTATNMTIGTLPYAAPEQLTDEPIDGRADQYALAATAYHLLTGSPLFPQTNPAVVISRHLNAPPPALADTRPELAALDPVLAVALAKDPADRFASCTDFAWALTDALQPQNPSGAMPTTPAPVVSKRPPSTPRPPVPEDPDGQKQRRRGRVLLGAALAVVLVAALGVIGYQFVPKHKTIAAPPAAVLDGTYKVTFNYAKQLFNGAPGSGPPPGTNNTFWWAFRSHCTSTGCTANDVGLDTKNPQIVDPNGGSNARDYHFADGHWQETPYRRQDKADRCLGVNGTIVAGEQTTMTANSLEPQPDGTLHGLTTVTVLTNECGNQGIVVQSPYVAERTGDVPAGVSIPDPAGVTTAPATTTARAPSGGPVLDGSYRFDFDQAGQTVNGKPTNGDEKKETHWWAFRSQCTPTRCVATASALADNNQQVPTGGAMVLEFTDQRWQQAPALLPRNSCEASYSGPIKVPTGDVADTQTLSWSLEPQQDGTLRGVSTTSVLSNECGFRGNTYKTTVVATRVADVPPSVVLADPALF